MPQIPTLPQQSNYAIHTSQAATTSRAPFSEAEESTDIDDSDDRLSWQAVREEARTFPRTTKVATVKKNKLQGIVTHFRYQSLINLKLCDTQKPRALVNTRERIQHHHRYLSQESQTCSD
jgi:hypothetical protein